MAETPEQRLERVARALCEARGIEPDSLQAYDNGTMAYTRTHAWRLAAAELKAAKLLADHVAMLNDGVQASGASPRDAEGFIVPDGFFAESDGVRVLDEAQPVAWVPIHPRNGPLWSMTTDKPDPERLPASYPLRPLTFADGVDLPHGAQQCSD